MMEIVVTWEPKTLWAKQVSQKAPKGLEGEPGNKDY